MKLLTKSNLYYLGVIVPLLLVAGVFTFFIIGKAVQENTDESLWNEKEKAEKLLDTFSLKSKMYLSFDLLSSIQIDSSAGKGFKYTDAIKMDVSGDEAVKWRVLKSYYKSHGENYLVTISRPTIEEDDLIENLLQSLMLIAAFVLFAFFVVNWLVSKKLWKPFYSTIGQLNNYDVKRNSALELKNTSTREFKQLNEAVLKMTNKMRKDFISQKEFSENAAHELQTPIAVVKARLDLLVQSPNLKESEMGQLQVIENAINKLASLNKSLLLLTKIENNQFKEVEEIEIGSVVNRMLMMYEDVILTKKISVVRKSDSSLKLNINPMLAEILVGNLIQNAIRHNVVGGEISIEIKEKQFSIGNTGEPLKVEANQLFERFKKNDASKESLGLGLSIVKSIIETCNLSINYSFDNNQHSFTITI